MSTLVPEAGPDDHIRGSLDAPVVIVEFGDFQCPFCGEAYLVLRSLGRDFGEQVAFVFRNFPLVQAHEHALVAAEAAEAASEQSRFWDMQDWLYEHQTALDPAQLVRAAETLGLDVDRFVTDANSERIRSRIAADLRSGEASGVPGTPTFFFNGHRHQGDATFESLRSVVERLLGAA